MQKRNRGYIFGRNFTCSQRTGHLFLTGRTFLITWGNKPFASKQGIPMTSFGLLGLPCEDARDKFSLQL
ncbi:hypothetical protein AAFF_G00026710 [Aldrovandia affinis]|uniref:Uncharacterized protein n=1 Tax=Aldrovandia affinis TaxID=143900 RepID=A0AAD7S4W2_9TELE|nr:hypothetical protein AAFF_G00026710 [Aldrovandia affinis]